MSTLVVERSGIHVTVQDAGRLGYRALGVPASGALDGDALHLANAVAGNPPGCGALELLYSGITVRVSDGEARLALAATDGIIEHAAGGVTPLPAWHSATLRAGDRLRVTAPAATAVAYLAVEGGFRLPAVLGSVATYTAGALGGHEGRLVRAGDALPLAHDRPDARSERGLTVPLRLAAPELLRVLPGPQFECFAGTAGPRLAGQTYRVTPASNRSGLRLEGPPLAHRSGHDLLSEGVATGSIQVPGSGQPVLLIGDHPTVGGYPKIAVVIAADLAAAGRLRIGSEVRFALVDEHAARAARHAARERLAALLERMADVG